MFSLLSSELKIQQVCWLHPREIKFSSSFTSSKAKQTSFTCWNQAKRFLFFFYWVQLFSRRLNNLVWAEARLNWMAFLLSWLLGTYLESLKWKQFAIWTKKFPIQFCKWKHNQRESILFLFLIQKRLFIEKRDVLVFWDCSVPLFQKVASKLFVSDFQFVQFFKKRETSILIKKTEWLGNIFEYKLSSLLFYLLLRFFSLCVCLALFSFTLSFTVSLY